MKKPELIDCNDYDVYCKKDKEECPLCLMAKEKDIECDDIIKAFNKALELSKAYYENILCKKDEKTLDEILEMQRLLEWKTKELERMSRVILRQAEEINKLDKLYADTCMLDKNTEAKRMKENIDLREENKKLKKEILEDLKEGDKCTNFNFDTAELFIKGLIVKYT